MGKGDIKTRRGKIFTHSYGVKRPRKKKCKNKNKKDIIGIPNKSASISATAVQSQRQSIANKKNTVQSISGEKIKRGNKISNNEQSNTDMIEFKNKCCLCEKKEADQTGSHIVPHFLLKRVVNVEGKTQRDYELGFRIDRMGMSSHFGRAVQPEKLEETFGEVSDEDISKNQQQLVVDNYYCSGCEKRFSLIESAYSNTLSKIDTNIYESGVSSIIGLLFWGSIVWRMSNHGQSGVKLKHEQEELLKNILDKYLPKEDIKELDSIDLDNSEDLSRLSYKLIRFNNIEENESKFVLIDPEYDNCSVLLIDEYILAFIFDKNYEDFEKNGKLGLEKLFESVEENEINGNERIHPFAKDVYSNIRKKLIDIAKEHYYSGVSEYCDIIHRELEGHGDTMPQEIKNEIFQELALTEKKLGRKYTQEDLVSSTMKVMQKYCEN